MTNAPPITLMTADEVMDLPEPSGGTRYEIVRGKLLCMRP